MKYEFILRASETGSSTDEEYIFDTLLDLSKEFHAQWRYMIDMANFRHGDVVYSNMAIKYIRDDGFTRNVWVEIGQPEEF